MTVIGYILDGVGFLALAAVASVFGWYGFLVIMCAWAELTGPRAGLGNYCRSCELTTIGYNGRCWKCGTDLLRRAPRRPLTRRKRDRDAPLDYPLVLRGRVTLRGRRVVYREEDIS